MSLLPPHRDLMMAWASAFRKLLTTKVPWEALNRPLSRAVTVLAALLWGFPTAPPVAAQGDPEVRILAVVDYRTETEIYLAAGAEQGIAVGDTLQVFRSEDLEESPAGAIVVVSANGRRSVAGFVGESFPVSRAETLYLGMSSAVLEARLGVLERDRAATDADRQQQERMEPAATVQGASGAGPTAEPREPVRIDGRISLDLDALRTTTRWGDSEDEEANRTFSTPTFRLQARVRDLPGGFRLSTNMRVSHRSSTDDVVQPRTSARFYQFDLERRFETVPLQLHLGRFHNPYDEFGGYYDGVMARIGGQGFGAGAAVGFEPELWNEGISTDRPKMTGFLDYSARGETARYSGSLSYHTLRPRSDLPDETYVGFSQGLGVGRLWIRHRIRVDRSAPESEWNLTRLQVDASLPLGGGFTARGGWRRWRTPTALTLGDPGPRRDRANVGLSYWSAPGGVTLDLSLDRPEGGERARTVSGSFSLRQTGVLGLGLSGLASYWKRGERSSLFLSPELRREVGPAHVRGAYRFYRTRGGSGETRHQFSDLGLSLPLGQGLQARLQGSVQWGESFSSNRILASLWKAF